MSFRRRMDREKNQTNWGEMDNVVTGDKMNKIWSAPYSWLKVNCRVFVPFTLGLYANSMNTLQEKEWYDLKWKMD